ncbi:MerR family transcriptional regulator [Streptomyces globisporus]|uniref:MerR family transcriptional regulator n=1 Tax=Streptomyces globisporus TaxID=1908 RepID=UPI0037B86B20
MDTYRSRPMTVGELSRRTGVPVKALREYTDSGLIYTLGRSPANYRLYDTDALWCVRFIGELRGLGLTVAEIRELTAAWSDGDGKPVGSHLAELLHRSRERLCQRIAAQQQVLERIEKFETEHEADLAEGDLCWACDPRGCDVRA